MITEAEAKKYISEQWADGAEVDDVMHWAGVLPDEVADIDDMRFVFGDLLLVQYMVHNKLAYMKGPKSP